MVGIKDWAKQKGIDEKSIVYDPVTKKVKVNGFDYGTARPTYQTNYQPMQLSDMTRNYVPTRVQTGLSADSYQLNDAYDRQRIDEANKARSKALTDYERALSQPYQPGQFTYDQNKDVGYQSALSQANMNIRDATNRALEEMNKRGILNSTLTTDRANRIASDEMSRIATQVAPQLENQAYNRFLQQEQQKYGTWQDMVKLANNRLDLANNVYNERNNAYLQAQKQREAKATELSKMYGKVVTPTLNPSDMTKQVAGLQTIDALELAQKQAEARAKAQQAQAEARMKQAESDREYNLKLDKFEFDKQQANKPTASGGTGGSGTGKTGGKTPKVTREKIATIQEMISKSGAVTKDDNKYLIDAKTGLPTYDENPNYGKVTKNESLIKQIINDSNTTANDRIRLFNSYEMKNEVNRINNDPNLKLANSSNPADKNIVIQRIYQSSQNPEDRARKLVYYGLWDYFYENT